MTRLLFVVVICSLFYFSFLVTSGCRWSEEPVGDISAESIPMEPPQRIISMCPSITETICALELEDRLVGVSRFCKFPETVQSLPKVGGYLDPNYEAILELKPDLVILLKESTAIQERLKALNIRCLAVNHQSIEGILESFTQIGDACGAATKAGELVADIRERIETLEKRSVGKSRPKVLLALRMTPERRIQTVMVTGANPFFQESLRIAGAGNAQENPRTPFPQISREGIRELNPDVIVDLAGAEVRNQYSAENFAEGWTELGNNITAVKNHRIYLMAEDYVLIPGPRFILFIEDLAKIIDFPSPIVDFSSP